MDLKRTVLAPVIVGDAGLVVAWSTGVLTGVETAGFITSINTLAVMFQLYLWSEA